MTIPPNDRGRPADKLPVHKHFNINGPTATPPQTRHPAESKKAMITKGDIILAAVTFLATYALSHALGVSLLAALFCWFIWLALWFLLAAVWR